jgi:hypothetical protein
MTPIEIDEVRLWVRLWGGFGGGLWASRLWGGLGARFRARLWGIYGRTLTHDADTD